MPDWWMDRAMEEGAENARRRIEADENGPNQTVDLWGEDAEHVHQGLEIGEKGVEYGGQIMQAL